jgi:hypothetical protein
MWALLKDDRFTDQTIVGLPDLDDEVPFRGIRCPVCEWRPSPASRWLCLWIDTPEPLFPACGTAWNTFTTHGRCPGCGHQWQWTSCLRCGEWSRHVDWYEETGNQ